MPQDLPGMKSVEIAARLCSCCCQAMLWFFGDFLSLFFFCGLWSLPVGNKVQHWLSQVMGVSSCVGTGHQQGKQTNLTDMQEQEPRAIRTLDLELDPGRLLGVSSWSL